MWHKRIGLFLREFRHLREFYDLEELAKIRDRFVSNNNCDCVCVRVCMGTKM